jgi:hypothetical protein
MIYAHKDSLIIDELQTALKKYGHTMMDAGDLLVLTKT